MFPFIPIGHFILIGWITRRDELLFRFTDSAIDQYYTIFYPMSSPRDRESFEKDYYKKYGRKNFLFPCIFFFLTITLLIYMCASVVFKENTFFPQSTDAQLYTFVFAVAGAYVWVGTDLIAKSRINDLVTADINNGSIRFIISVGLAYALSVAFSEAWKLPFSFFLGAFPTETLFKLMRRQVSKSFDSVADAGGNNIQELLSIDGINVPIAERFVDEGIGTVLQLAYCDPVALSIKSGKDFSFVLDCMSQALLAMNFRNHLEIVRQKVVRGAQEVRWLMQQIESADSQKAAAADKPVNSLAAALSLSKEETLFILYQIAEDPYAIFTWEVWGN